MIENISLFLGFAHVSDMWAAAIILTIFMGCMVSKVVGVRDVSIS